MFFFIKTYWKIMFWINQCQIKLTRLTRNVGYGPDKLHYSCYLKSILYLIK